MPSITLFAYLFLYFHRALVRSMGEILFLCGSNKGAVIATLSILDPSTDRAEDTLEDGVSCNLAYLIILFQFIC